MGAPSRFLVRFLLVCACATAGAPEGHSQPNFPTRLFALPADIMSSAPISGWSVAQRLGSGYNGPAFTVVRDDLQSLQIGFAKNSDLVDVVRLRQFCDGHDCYAQVVNDQFGQNPLLGAPSVSNSPLIGYELNGLPVLLMERGWYQAAVGTTGLAVSTGRWMYNGNTTGLPTSGSQVMFFAGDNGYPSQCCEAISYSSANPVGLPPTGDVLGDAMAPVIMISTPNVPASPGGALIGLDLETAYRYGAYPDVYGMLAGFASYSATTGNLRTGVLTSACLPSLSSPACAYYTTFSGAATAFNPGFFGNPVIRLGSGTDGTQYGGHVQSAIVAGYKPGEAETGRVLNALGAVAFPKTPGPCVANATLVATGAITATPPFSGAPTAVQPYVGAGSLNEANLVAAWSTSVWNQDYHGPLFRVRNETTQKIYDIGPLGCEADIPALTADCSGATCAVVKLFDQSGHNFDFVQENALTQPVISISGINSKPCVQFSSVANFSVTASVAANTGSQVGFPTVMTVTATAGTIVPGLALLSNIRHGTVLSYIAGSGTPGGIGQYLISNPNNYALSSGTITLSASPYMHTQSNIWFGQSPTPGLEQNMTVELAFQSNGTLNNYGSFIGMTPGWWIGSNLAALNLTFGHNGATDLVGPVWTAGAAHFAYVTTDSGAPQNLAIAVDGGAATTGTTTNQASLSAATEYLLGAGQTSVVGGVNYLNNACIAMAAIYNDIESSSNLIAANALAQAKW